MRTHAAPNEAQQRGLPPVLGSDTRVLILGSFPGTASLAARQYYAHPRNAFWPILAELVAEPLVSMPYEMRLARLLAHRIGLWDTIVVCTRSGSLDADIRDATRAEVGEVRRIAPNVAVVCFNGNTAARAQPQWRDAGYETVALPSTSPAYTRPFAEKLAAWKLIGAHLAHGTRRLAG